MSESNNSPDKDKDKKMNHRMSIARLRKMSSGASLPGGGSNGAGGAGVGEAIDEEEGMGALRIFRCVMAYVDNHRDVVQLGAVCKDARKTYLDEEILAKWLLTR
jgi:hypothetical protein